MNHSMGKLFFVFSPACDQSQAIAGFIRKYINDADIRGVLLPEEDNKFHDNRFDEVLPITEVRFENTTGVMIPTGALSTRFLLEQWDDIKVGLITLSRNSLQVYDKLFMISCAAKVGVPVPILRRTGGEGEIYPVFYKERYEIGGGIRGIARTRREIPEDKKERLIFQEFIDSRGTYGVSFLSDMGRLLTTHTHYERESIPKEGGSAVIIERFEDDRLLEYTRRIIQSMDYSGWGLSEFKYCPNRHDYVFMEINAKFWASCEFSFKNEPTFLKLLFDIESNEKPINRMVFVDRLFDRGLLFVIRNLGVVLSGSTLCVYHGWSRRIAAGLIPLPLRRIVKKILANIGH
jgi:hypothetical protein